MTTNFLSEADHAGEGPPRRGTVLKVVIASDAGHASTVLLSTQLRRRLPAGTEVSHSPVDAVPGDADVVLAPTTLVGLAERYFPRIPTVGYEQAVGDPAIDAFVRAAASGRGALADQ